MTADPPTPLIAPAPVLRWTPGRRGRRLAARLARRLLGLVLAPFRPRVSGVGHLTDRQLADIGLTRHDLPPSDRGQTIDAALALRFRPRS